MSTLTATAKAWDQVRSTFATSIMVDTPLSSLAQNLDGPDWPLKGKNETPASYIDLNHEEVVELLALKGQPPERLEQLIDILRDTLAFDAPFGDMVAQNEASSAQDNPVLKNLAKLEIPEDYPITLTALSRETLEFCALEKLSTLSEFAIFAQNMAQTVIVGGDFRALLNALSHVDEAVIARYLPFRPGQKGLHLIEAVAMYARSLPPESWSALIQRQDSPSIETVGRLGQLLSRFAADATKLRAQIAEGESLARLVSILRDAKIEPVVVALLSPHFAPVPAQATTAKKRGFFARLFGR